MYQLIIKPHAVEMAMEAYDWYEEQQLGLGELFLAELDACYDKLETWPTAYAKIKRISGKLYLRLSLMWSSSKLLKTKW